VLIAAFGTQKNKTLLKIVIKV